MKIVMPARYASSRLPGKPLILLGGKAMIVQSWTRALDSVRGVRPIVATEDSRIADVCDDHDIGVVMTSGTCRTGTDRTAELLSMYPDEDVWVVAMGDNPLLPIGVIPTVVAGLTRDVAATIGRAQISAEEAVDPTTHKLTIDVMGNVLYISRSSIPHGDGPFWKAVNVFAMWRETLQLYPSLPLGPNEEREGLEILRLVEHGYKVRTVEVSGEGFSVDVPADAERARAVCDREHG